MPSSVINSDDGVISGTSGLKSSGGDDGVLVFQSKGTETARINTDSQIVAAAGTASLPALTTTGDVNTGIFFPAADTIAFAEGGAEAMRIDSSGNVGIGTTSPTLKLDVLGNARVKNNNGCIVENAAGNYRQMYMSGADYYFFNGTNQAYLSSAGSWTNASDALLKTNIREIEYGLNTVVATQPRHFERVDVDGTYIGFIAQELQQVIPEVVMGDAEKQLGVDYGSLVAVAFKAIQELSAKNDALEARIAALEQA